MPDKQQLSGSGQVVKPEEPRVLPVLKLTDISKSFGGAKALAGVSFEVRSGEVHGLLGKNGSGKSTLVKILAGFHAPDHGGTLKFNGNHVNLPLKPGNFRHLGMSFVHQNLGLVPSLTVLENLRFGQITAARSAFIDWSSERSKARDALSQFGLALDTDQRIDRLSSVERALLAIVRAFEEIRIACAATGRPGLVLLDEPTPFLPREGIDKLFSLIRQIAESGSSVVFISHDIEEVMTITDRVTVLRDGAVAGELETAKASHEQVVEMIVGRSLAKRTAPIAHEPETRPVFAQIKNIAGGMLQPTDLCIREGEIIGLTGLIGSGYEEIPYLLFGARPSRSGSVTFSGKEPIALADMSPKRAIDMNFALLPGDRQAAGGVDSLSLMDNMLLPDISTFFRGGLLNRNAMLQKAHTLGARYEVRPNDPFAKFSSLSGGNAQKVLIARWMNRNPSLLLLDEPTQGVDVQTRVQIFAAIRAAAVSGMSVFCASSDAEQLAEICHRVLVFSRGRLCKEIVGADLTKDGIAEACYASIGVTSRADPSTMLAS